MPEDINPQRVLERIMSDRGTVSETVKLMAKYDPRFLAHHHERFMLVMEESRQIPRLMKELMLVALDAVTYFDYGIRLHMREALRLGATAEQLMEALEVAAFAGGGHAVINAMHLLDEAVAEHSSRGPA